MSKFTDWFRRPRGAEGSLDDRHLKLSWPVQLVLFGVAVIVGQSFYADLLGDNHLALRERVAGTDALCQVAMRSAIAAGVPGSTAVCSTATMTPSVDPEAPRLDRSEQGIRFQAWIQGLQVARQGDEELDLADPGTTRWALMLQAIQARSLLRDQMELRSPPTLSSVSLLAELAAGLNSLTSAANSCTGAAPAALVSAHAQALAPVLAAEPADAVNVRNVTALADTYRQRATEDAKTEGGGDCVERILSVVPAKSDWKRYGFMIRGASRVSDAVVLQALLRGFGVLKEEGWTTVLREVTPPDEAPVAATDEVPEETAPDPEAKPSAEAAELPTSERLAQQRAVADFMLSVMSEIRAAPEVRSAQFNVTLWRGGEQLAMIVVAVWAILLMIVRTVRSSASWRALRSLRGIAAVSDADLATQAVRARARRPGEKEDAVIPEGRLRSAASVLELEKRLFEMPDSSTKFVAFSTKRMAEAGGFDAAALRALTQTEADAIYNSGWLIRLLLAILPAIGFLGTVLGIMAALADVDAISRVPAGPQQAVEVSFVAGTLGLAFATTAIALLAGLLLRYLHEAISAWETRMVTEQEALLVPIVDPTLWHDE